MNIPVFQHYMNQFEGPRDLSPEFGSIAIYSPRVKALGALAILDQASKEGQDITMSREAVDAYLKRYIAWVDDTPGGGRTCFFLKEHGKVSLHGVIRRSGEIIERNTEGGLPFEEMSYHDYLVVPVVSE